MLWEQLRTASGRKLNKNEVQQIIIKFILGECRNLQILILEGSVLHFPLTEQRDLRRIPFHFLAHSLKKLHLGASNNPARMLNAQSVIWILLYCPHLLEAYVTFGLNLKSSNFLVEYSGTFEGLSGVKKLASRPILVWDVGDFEEGKWLGEAKENEGGKEEKRNRFSNTSRLLKGNGFKCSFITILNHLPNTSV